MYIKKCFSKFIGEDNKCKSIVRKVLSIGVSFSLMFGMVPSSMVSAAEPTSFVTEAYGNHWGRSDLRAYLNNGTKGDLDMSGSGNGDNYPSYFSDEEYNLVEPHTYSTNEFADPQKKGTVTCVHETTDKFWLPSGTYRSQILGGKFLSWGSEDISGWDQYYASVSNDIQRLIPQSYWSHGKSMSAWARSPYYNSGGWALMASRGSGVHYYNVNGGLAVAAAFKISLSSVIFSSAASAESHAGVVGGTEIPIRGTGVFGKEVEFGLPRYGMYLKKESTHTFTPSDLSFSNNTLTVNYSGGIANQCIMVQAFKSDDLTDGTKSYVVGKQLTSESGTLDVDVSKWNLDSLDDYTIKVWMEDKSSSSLASATEPVTFVGKNYGGVSSIEKTTEGETKNLRVFAMKSELQCSWGTLETEWDLSGDDATNQKIYFGSNKGTPLEFWIAGREDSTNNYQIDPGGDIMTLYQAVSVGELRQFNDSRDDYEVNGSRVTLQLGGNAEFKWTKTEPTIKYTGSITAKVVNSESGEETDLTRNLMWQFRTPGSGTWHDTMPIDNGDYELRCYVMGVSSRWFEFERTYSQVVTFTVSDIPARASNADG